MPTFPNRDDYMIVFRETNTEFNQIGMVGKHGLLNFFYRKWLYSVLHVRCLIVQLFVRDVVIQLF
jgi:hypothetical protein